MARRSRINFDGGDFLTDRDNVCVMPRVLSRNIQQTVTNRQEFLDLLARELKRHVILLDEAPDHHAGMFMVSPGNKVMLVADPSLGQKLLPAGADLPGGPDFSPETQHLFDSVAARCAIEGYKVVRIPVVPARDGRSYLTYVNVLMDEQKGRRIGYPALVSGLRGTELSRTEEFGENIGYEIRPVDCTATYRHFGCLHCLVNAPRGRTASL